MNQNEIKEEIVEFKHGQEIEQEQAEITTLTGEYLNRLANKRFEIISYKTIMLKDKKDKKNPENLVKTLILRVKLEENGLILDYFPNKSSKNTLISELGLNYKDWVGFKGEFEMGLILLNGDKKRVIYVK